MVKEITLNGLGVISNLWENIVVSIAEKGKKETANLNSQLTGLFAFTMAFIILIVLLMWMLTK